MGEVHVAGGAERTSEAGLTVSPYRRGLGSSCDQTALAWTSVFWLRDPILASLWWGGEGN